MAGDIEKLINALIESRQMTLSDLTAQLGYHSKTSLVRIMKGQVNQRAVDAFAKRVQSSIQLTQSESAQLSEVMDFLRWRQDYESSCEMLRFLCGEQMADRDVWLEEVDSGRRQCLLDRYANASEIRITLLNSQYVPIFEPLCELVQKKGATVEHFLQMRREPARLIHAIGELIPLIYERGYSGYCSSSVEDGETGGVRGILDADVMVVRYRSDSGEICEDIAVFDAVDHGFVHTSSTEGGRLFDLLSICREQYKPIKNLYFQNSELNSYIEFCEKYAKIEQNRTIYKIKPDVCLAWIPEDILFSALLEGKMGEMENIDELMAQFGKIHHERVRNVYEKRRVTRAILKRSAMVRFARTGRVQDHFWGMRPFTPAERIRIIRLLMDQNENNPYFSVFFLKDNDFLRDLEIVYYEDMGIMMTDSTTDYALQGNHSEVLIVHDEFMRMFREYFERSLLVDHVMTRADTAVFLDGLIKIILDEQ